VRENSGVPAQDVNRSPQLGALERQAACTKSLFDSSDRAPNQVSIVETEDGLLPGDTPTKREIRKYGIRCVLAIDEAVMGSFRDALRLNGPDLAFDANKLAQVRRGYLAEASQHPLGRIIGIGMRAASRVILISRALVDRIDSSTARVVEMLLNRAA